MLGGRISPRAQLPSLAGFVHFCVGSAHPWLAGIATPRPCTGPRPQIYHAHAVAIATNPHPDATPNSTPATGTPPSVVSGKVSKFSICGEAVKTAKGGDGSGRFYPDTAEFQGVKPRTLHALPENNVTALTLKSTFQMSRASGRVTGPIVSWGGLQEPLGDLRSDLAGFLWGRGASGDWRETLFL